MSGYEKIIKKEFQPRFQTIVDDRRARANPDYFPATGTNVYCGVQGSGKTISAIKHLMDIKYRYPKSLVVSNIQLTILTPKTFSNKTELKAVVQNIDAQNEYIYFNKMDELAMALTSVNNGFKGVIYIIDEIHTYFNALESKNIPMYVFTEISQQRKQRKLIIGTSQLFLRMAKPLREQCDNVITCNTHFGAFTVTRAWDGMSLAQDMQGKLTGKQKKTGFFWHTRKIRAAFDTFQKVVSGSEQYETVQQITIPEQKKGLFAKRK
jgi:hypothetical protein